MSGSNDDYYSQHLYDELENTAQSSLTKKIETQTLVKDVVSLDEDMMSKLTWEEVLELLQT